MYVFQVVGLSVVMLLNGVELARVEARPPSGEDPGWEGFATHADALAFAESQAAAFTAYGYAATVEDLG